MRKPLILCALAIAVVGGCTSAPRVGEIVEPSELKLLAAALSAGVPDAGSYRGTGDGEISVSGRTLGVSFAVVYERPGWLRADLRPALGSLGASMTSLALMEGDCARFFFPARLIVVDGCISEIAPYGDWIDPVSLILGLPDPSFITKLSGVTSSHRRGQLILDGVVEDSRVRVSIDEERAVITGVELGRVGTEESINIEYSGHGWKAGSSVPRTIEFLALEGTSREVGVTLRYSTLRWGEPVDRDAHALAIPEGVLEVNWQELNLWR